MKKFILLLLTLLTAGCVNNEKKAAMFLYDTKDDPFVRAFARQINNEARGRFDLQSFDSRKSQIIQNELIENSIKENYSLMLINPVDRLGAHILIRKLKEENIPVIFFNREPLKRDILLWEKVFYIGARAEESAQLQAELIMNLFGGNPDNLNRFDKNQDGKIQVVILKGEQGHQDAETRTREVISTFRFKGYSLDVIRTIPANWNTNEADEKLDPVITEQGDKIEVIIFNNDAMALGAIRRLKKRDFFIDDNKDGIINSDDFSWLPIVGIDGLNEAVEQIKLGYLYGTVLNDSQSMAEAITELSRRLLNDIPLDGLPWPLEDGHYIWINYKPFTLERS